MTPNHRKLKIALIVAVAVALMAATIPAAIWVTNTQTARLGNARARCQAGQHKTYHVIIQNGLAVPTRTAARKCDKLTITNRDNRVRLMAFGPHDHHVSYDGVSERVLGQGQSLTVTLITPGTFIFHDHTDPAAQGTFTVSN
ncbi:MAG TPA: cupredoxin domain-containing protein [Candidatus Dormibacteraeota bacterium]|nr:cupredoxin domain-containing protein [Candidatus Dormibacteraeota bacterium]